MLQFHASNTIMQDGPLQGSVAYKAQDFNMALMNLSL